MPLIGFGKSFSNFAKPAVAASSGLVRGRPIIDGGTIKTAERTLMRGVTMALDGPGSMASVYTTNRANWQKFRDLKFNIVRVPFSIEYENNTLSSMLPDMDATVANASATGMYCMFMLDGEYGQANYDEFERVWPTVAARYKNNTNVFYEMNNEPHWVSSHFTNASFDRIGRVYNLMHDAAPDTLIGVLTPASLEDGEQATINAVNALKSRGVTFGPAFAAIHIYSSDIPGGGNTYSSEHVRRLKAAVPCLMTETVNGGPDNHDIPDDEVYKIQELEALQVSWMVLQPRYGEVGPNEHTPYSNDETSLTGRILTDLAAAGSYNWPQDSIVSARNALPAGRLFEPPINRAFGVPNTVPAGGAAGRVFAVPSSLVRGAVTATTGTSTLPKSITLNPANPGSIQQTTAGATVAWTTTISAQNITAGVTWAVYTSANVQRGSATAIPNNNAGYTITVQFTATGDKLRVWETGNTAVNVESGAVTVLAASSRSITINPMSPGTVAAGTVVPTEITTTGITNMTYALVDADWAWRNGSTLLAMTSTGQTRMVNITYTSNGQFLKVFDTNDPNFKVDANAVVIQPTVPAEPVGSSFYTNFSNGDTGALTHIWGDRRQLSVSNGILRLQGLSGEDPWKTACGVMMWPGGPDKGFGYGTYEWEIRQADFLGDNSGGCALVWPGDDIWPGAEEDMGEITRDGDWYVAHHWKGPPDSNGHPTDAYRYWTVPWLNPANWFFSRMILKRDYIEFRVNDTFIISSTENVTRVYGDGVDSYRDGPNGMNRVPGLMNRSSNTWIEARGFKFTPGNP